MRLNYFVHFVEWVMKMGNGAPKEGFELTPLAFWASVLTITPHRLPDITTIPTPICLCGSQPKRSAYTTIKSRIGIYT